MSYTSSGELRMSKYVAFIKNKSVRNQGDNVAYRNTSRETPLNRRADPQMLDIPAALSGTKALNTYWE